MDISSRHVGYLLLLLVINAAGAAGKVLKVAWMCPMVSNLSSCGSSVAALKLGLKTVEKNPNILSGHNISVKYFDTACNGQAAMMSTMMTRQSYDPDIFIGPPCEEGMKVVAQLSSFWNLPVFGWSNGAVEFDGVFNYPTLVRMAPPYRMLASGLLHLFRENNWSKFSLLHDGHIQWRQLEEAVKTEVHQTGGIRILYSAHQVDRNISDVALNTVLVDAKKYYKVIVFACPAESLRSYLLAAYRLGLTSGNTVFIYSDNQIHTDSSISKVVLGDGLWRWGQSDDVTARNAFKSLIHVMFDPMNDNKDPTLSIPRSRFTDFAKLARKGARLSRPLWNLPKSTTPDVQSMFLYDALLVWSVLADRLIKGGKSHRDGQQMAGQAKLFSAEGATGHIDINNDLDRNGKLFVLGMASTGHFRPVQVLQFNNTDEYSVEDLVPRSEFTWSNVKQGTQASSTTSTIEITSSANRTTTQSPIQASTLKRIFDRFHSITTMATDPPITQRAYVQMTTTSGSLLKPTPNKPTPGPARRSTAAATTEHIVTPADILAKATLIEPKGASKQTNANEFMISNNAFEKLVESGSKTRINSKQEIAIIHPNSATKTHNRHNIHGESGGSSPVSQVDKVPGTQKLDFVHHDSVGTQSFIPRPPPSTPLSTKSSDPQIASDSLAALVDRLKALEKAMLLSLHHDHHHDHLPSHKHGPHIVQPHHTTFTIVKAKPTTPSTTISTSPKTPSTTSLTTSTTTPSTTKLTTTSATTASKTKPPLNKADSNIKKLVFTLKDLQNVSGSTGNKKIDSIKKLLIAALNKRRSTNVLTTVPSITTPTDSFQTTYMFETTTVPRTKKPKPILAKTKKRRNKKVQKDITNVLIEKISSQVMNKLNQQMATEMETARTSLEASNSTNPVEIAMNEWLATSMEEMPPEMALSLRMAQLPWMAQQQPTRPPTQPPTWPPTYPPTHPPTLPPTRPPTWPPTYPPTLPPTRPPQHLVKGQVNANLQGALQPLIHLLRQVITQQPPVTSQSDWASARAGPVWDRQLILQPTIPWWAS